MMVGRARSYYRVELELKSALSIGCANSVLTDSDVVLDGRGRPLIPATSLAGVMRHTLDPERAEAIFGSREVGEGALRVYDAVWTEGNRSVSLRDNVTLEHGVAKEGLKFDRQIVEPGARFVWHLEVIGNDLFGQGDIVRFLSALNSGALRLGAKSTRGMGEVGVVNCQMRLFDLNNVGQRDQWLEFDQFNDGHWPDGSSISLDGDPSADAVITLSLAQRGAISVREYSTEPGRPDFSQLYVRSSDPDGKHEDQPIIPGTSWAGAIRERCAVLSGDAGAVDELFGCVRKVKGQTHAQRSQVSISETPLSGGTWKEITRNSIDRFTGGTKDGALFTLRTYYGGNCKLVVRIAQGQVALRDAMRLLLPVLADVANGLLCVGGLGAVGHGIFEVKDISLSIKGKSMHDFEQQFLKRGKLGFVEPDIASLADSVCAFAKKSAAPAGTTDKVKEVAHDD